MNNLKILKKLETIMIGLDLRSQEILLIRKNLSNYLWKQGELKYKIIKNGRNKSKIKNKNKNKNKE